VPIGSKKNDEKLLNITSKHAEIAKTGNRSLWKFNV